MAGEVTVREELRPALLQVIDRWRNDGDGTFIPYETHDERVLVHAVLGSGTGFVTVEFEDGHIERVNLDRVRFLDSGKLFGEVSWDGV